MVLKSSFLKKKGNLFLTTNIRKQAWQTFFAVFYWKSSVGKSESILRMLLIGNFRSLLLSAFLLHRGRRQVGSWKTWFSFCFFSSFHSTPKVGTGSRNTRLWRLLGQGACSSLLRWVEVLLPAPHRVAFFPCAIEYGFNKVSLGNGFMPIPDDLCCQTEHSLHEITTCFYASRKMHLSSEFGQWSGRSREAGWSRDQFLFSRYCAQKPKGKMRRTVLCSGENKG